MFWSINRLPEYESPKVIYKTGNNPVNCMLPAKHQICITPTKISLQQAHQINENIWNKKIIPRANQTDKKYLSHEINKKKHLYNITSGKTFIQQ